MLDNEPNDTSPNVTSAGQNARKSAARKTAKKTAAKQPAVKAAKKAPAKKTVKAAAGTTTARGRAAKKTAEELPAAATAVSTQSDGGSADPAPAPAKKTAAKKAAAQKTAQKTTQKTAPAKKAVTRKTVKKAAAQPDPAAADAQLDPAQLDAAQLDAAQLDAAQAEAPAKKATRKRTARKTADSAADQQVPAATVEATSPVDGGPVVESQPAVKKSTRKRAAKTTAKSAATQDLFSPASPASDGPVADLTDQADGSAGTSQGSASGASRRGAAGRGSASAGTGEAVEAGDSDQSAKRSRKRPPAIPVLFQPPTEVPSQAEATSPVEATPEDVEQAAETGTSSRRRRSRRGREEDQQAREGEKPQTPESDATSADDDTEAGRGTSRRRRRGAAQEADGEDRPTAVIEAGADEDAESGRGSSRRRRRGGAQETEAREDGPVSVDADAETGPGTSRRRRRGAVQETDGDEQVAEVVDDEDLETGLETDDGDGDEGGEGTRRRRRRRGGRRRRKSGDAGDEADDDGHDADAAEDADEARTDDDSHDDEDADGGGSSSRRRRRRRRRKGEEGASASDDPDEIVVKVREPRAKSSNNEITAVEGSTRLEAKKQRRREGRAAGRRRAPIVSEAEFLARRESVERTMVIRSREDLTQIAVSEDNVLVEHYVTTAEQSSMIGNVYLGRVQNVLPSMEAAFIDIGKGRNAVLYAGEVDWNTLGGGNGPRKIESVLKSGQAVLVQVTKDPVGHKGARLTNQISLPGRYVVYVPRGGNGGISRKLPDTERNRLKSVLKDIVPDEAGVIVRTAAEGASEEELTADVSRLRTFWDEIEKKSKNGQAPQLLYGEPDLLIRVVRDLFTEDFAKLVISGDDAYGKVSEYVAGVAPHLAARVEQWSGQGDVFANYRIDEQIKKAMDRKVWLPSGGSLIIDRTEAMTVVDVNTGKFTGSGGNLEETVTKNNLEAAEEIVRQLRLRDIGGIIVIDFIDMVLESNRDLVLRRLVECLGRDRTKHQVAEVTSLGLVQMTRKRIGTGLLEAFSENCDHCGGRGLILHDEPKESRRRQQDNRGGNEPKKSAQPQSADEGKKGSRRRRGRGKGEEDAVAEPHGNGNGDAALKLAQIAAASKLNGEHKPAGESGAEPTGYPVAESGQTPEATGYPVSETAAAVTSVPEVTEPVPGEAEPGEKSGRNGGTRRRRSSRNRSRAASDDAQPAPDSEPATEPASELVSHGG